MSEIIVTCIQIVKTLLVLVLALGQGSEVSELSDNHSITCRKVISVEM